LNLLIQCCNIENREYLCVVFKTLNNVKLKPPHPMATWNLDPAHTEIGFKARHLMITNVSGRFAQIDGSVVAESDDFSDAQFSFEADVASVDTKNADRDGHLKSPDFFDVENHPKLTFTSTAVEKAGAGELHVNGLMTIRGVEKPVRLQVEVAGVAVDPWGNTKAGLTFTGSLNRKDFGLSFHVVNEAGNLLVSDEIKLHGDVQLLKA
jgi:polyisoprenoid-binding protein YceI